MKKIALALVGLSMSSAALADVKINAFCYEDVKSPNAKAGYHGLFVGDFELGELEMTSGAAPDHSYKLMVYPKHHSRHLKKFKVLSDSLASFEMPAHSQPQMSCPSQSQGQSQAQYQQVKPIQAAPTTCEMMAPTNYEAIGLTAPACAPTCEQSQTQSCEQSQTQSYAQYQSVEQGQTQTCEQSQTQTYAQNQTCEQNQSYAQNQSGEQGQTQSYEQSQNQQSGSYFQGGTTQQSGAGQACSAPLASTSGPKEITVKLTNHWKLGDLKHWDDATLKEGETKSLHIKYHPGVGKFKPAIEVKCDVTYLGN
jgi:hypothetical protein